MLMPTDHGLGMVDSGEGYVWNDCVERAVDSARIDFESRRETR